MVFPGSLSWASGRAVRLRASNCSRSSLTATTTQQDLAFSNTVPRRTTHKKPDQATPRARKIARVATRSKFSALTYGKRYPPSREQTRNVSGMLLDLGYSQSSFAIWPMQGIIRSMHMQKKCRRYSGPLRVTISCATCSPTLSATRTCEDLRNTISHLSVRAARCLLFVLVISHTGYCRSQASAANRMIARVDGRLRRWTTVEIQIGCPLMHNCTPFLPNFTRSGLPGLKILGACREWEKKPTTQTRIFCKSWRWSRYQSVIAPDLSLMSASWLGCWSRFGTISSIRTQHALAS